MVLIIVTSNQLGDDDGDDDSIKEMLKTLLNKLNKAAEADITQPRTYNVSQIQPQDLNNNHRNIIVSRLSILIAGAVMNAVAQKVSDFRIKIKSY